MLRRVRHSALLGLLPPLAELLIRLLGRTLRVEIEDRAGLIGGREKIPACLFAFWHNRILMMPYFFQRYCPERSLSVMISESRDGELISAVAARFGIGSVRGSTSFRGMRALRTFVKLARERGADLGITPDGPRGPRYRLQPGVLLVSEQGGMPVCPVTVHYSGKWECPSWDRFQIPHPFATARLRVGPMLEGGEVETLAAGLLAGEPGELEKESDGC